MVKTRFGLLIMKLKCMLQVEDVSTSWVVERTDVFPSSPQEMLIMTTVLVVRFFFLVFFSISFLYNHLLLQKNLNSLFIKNKNMEMKS